MQQKVKPKLKALVYYAPTSDGVVIRSWSDEFVLKGKNMYDWMERLVPYLNGEQTVEQLTAALSEAHKQTIEQLLQELVSRSVVVDAAADAQVKLSPRELELYKQTLLFLECQCDEGREKFRFFRKSRVLLLGRGAVHASLVRSLLRMGLRSPIFCDGADPEVRKIVEEWKAQDEDFLPLWSYGKSGLYARPNLVVWAGDSNMEGEAIPWMERCSREKIPLLVTSMLPGCGAVGPVMDEDSRSSWLCLQHRWGIEAKQSLTDQEKAECGKLLGNVAAMEVLKYVCRMKQSNVREQVVTVGPGKLEIQRRLLLPSPLKTGERYNEQEALALFRMRREETASVALMASIRAAVDARTGILCSLQACELHSSDLHISPLHHVEAQMRLPGAGHDPQPFIGWGTTPEIAAEQAARQAMMAYAQSVSLQMRKLGLEAIHRADRCTTTADVVWACGRSYAEWRGRGILASVAGEQLANERQEARRMKVQLIPWDTALAHAQWLQQRLTQPVELTTRRLAYGIGVEVAVWNDGVLLGQSIGRCEEEALLGALQEAISNQQRGIAPTQARGEQAQPCTPGMETVQEQGYQSNDWDCSRDGRNLLPWTEWTADAERRLAEAGLELIMRPWLGDAALYDWGLLIGRFYLQARVGEGSH